MAFIAILETSEAQTGNRGNTVEDALGSTMYRVLYTPDCVNGEQKVLSRRQLVSEVVRGGHNLVNATVVTGTDVIDEDTGAFSRLKPKNGVVPHIIMAKYVSQQGNTIGYFLANSQTGKLLRAKPSAIYEACELARKKNGVFLQNAIYRVSGGVPQIAAYPGKSFHTFFQKLKRTPKQVNSEVDKQKNRQNLEQKHKDVYTPAQLKELEAAKKCGVNPIIIANPKLSPEQMRILWVGKRNKACVEYFANPKYSAEQMSFLSERLISQKAFLDCRALLNPKYDLAQMQEIYMGITDGVDYSVYAKPEIPADEMYNIRQELLAQEYNVNSIPVESYLLNMDSVKRDRITMNTYKRVKGTH